MSYRKFLPVFMGMLAALSTTVWAQSNTVLDKVLANKQATYGDAAYLVLTATKKTADSSTTQQAFTDLEKQGWGIKAKDAQAAITLGVYSYMLMKAFRMHGGIMYSLLPGPRYAARQLVYLGVVHGNGSPYRDITGIEAVNILSGVLNYEGASR